jgi:hypothetical protein
VIEVGLALWIVAIGALGALPVTGAGIRRAHIAVMMPCGYALYVVAALMLVILERFSAIGALALASAVALAAAGAWASRPERRGTIEWRRIFAGVAVVAGVAAVVAIVAQLVHVARLTPDSMAYLTAAGGLERFGSLDAGSGSAVLKRLLVVPALEAPGALTGRGYVASVMPLFAVAGVGLCAWLAHQALQVVATPRRWVAWILGSAGLFLLTTNRVVYNGAYIHTHLVFATFLLLGTGAAWLALQQRTWVLVLPAALGFAALPMLRAEAVIVVIVFLVPIVVELRVPVATRWALVAAPAATTFLWFGLAVPPQVKAAELGLTGPVFSNLLGIAGLIALVAATQSEPLRPITARAPAIVLGAVLAYVAVSVLRDPAVFGTSLAAMGANLTRDGGWGTFWPIAVLLVVVALIRIRLPFERLFTYPIVTYWVAVVAFAFLRDGAYRMGAGDSGNRMMMHIVFVTMVYLVMAAGALAAEAEATTMAPGPDQTLQSAGISRRTIAE